MAVGMRRCTRRRSARRGRGGAALAVHPARIAIHVVLFLPDRQAVLDLVDDVAAGAEGLVAMRRAHPDPHGQLADAEVTDTVHARGMTHPEARHRLGEDPLA